MNRFLSGLLVLIPPNWESWLSLRHPYLEVCCTVEWSSGRQWLDAWIHEALINNCYGIEADNRSRLDSFWTLTLINLHSSSCDLPSRIYITLILPLTMVVFLKMLFETFDFKWFFNQSSVSAANFLIEFQGFYRWTWCL